MSSLTNRNDRFKKRLKKLEKAKLTRRSSLEDILNVFTPNSPISEAAKFSGRYKSLETMINALVAKDADMIVYGERGCGKSSLALMLHDITKGNFEILDYYGLREHLEKKQFLSWFIGPSAKHFNVIWVDGFGRPLDDVIKSILNRYPDGMYGPGLLSYIPKEADQIEVSGKIGWNKIFTSQIETKEIHVRDQPINVKEGFEIAMQRYSSFNDKELIIIVDEFETVQNREEISQYLKSTKNARFILSGIATTTLELIGQHASVARDIHGIEVPPMDQEELCSILDIGEYLLSPFIRYSVEAKRKIINCCQGSPYWCHAIAKGLIQQKIDESDLTDFLNSSQEVNEQDVNSLIMTLDQRPEYKVYEQALEQITMENETIAKVLIGIAKSEKSVISSNEVSKIIEEENGISKEDVLKVIRGILSISGSPLEKRAEILDTISFSFRDPNFKRYIIMRNAGLPLLS